MMEFEKVTEKQVKSLCAALGVGAMIIDWTDIDYELGRGKKQNGDHCLFNKDGRRIDIGGYQYGLIAGQTKEPDPNYKNVYKKSEVE